MRWSALIAVMLAIPVLSLVPDTDVEAGILPATLSIGGPSQIGTFTPVTFQGRMTLPNGTGVPGVTVRLFASVGAASNLVGQGTTDATGNWRITHSFNSGVGETGVSFRMWAEAQPLPQASFLITDKYTSSDLWVLVRHKVDIQVTALPVAGCAVQVRAKLTDAFGNPLTFHSVFLTPLILPNGPQLNTRQLQTGLDGWTSWHTVERGSPGAMRLTWVAQASSKYHPSEYVHSLNVSC